jgi:hypothetical protein
MQKLIPLLCIAMFASLKSFSQQQICEVSIQAIKGTYTGNCDKGKANGTGKSIGTDIYEGEFKKGYPDGYGKYTWENKSYYEGYWKRGLREGKGTMHFIYENGTDSALTGFWKKDKFVGFYEKPFIINNTSSRISKVDCKVISNERNNIKMTFHQLFSASTMDAPMSVAELRSITVVEGTYYTKFNQVLGNNSVTYIQQVSFPFTAKFYMNNGEEFEIRFQEPGEWDVYVDIK